jgi:hypothetical protein
LCLVMNKIRFPKARKSKLLIRKVGNETVVYDTKTHNALALNELTTAVWEVCTGKSDASSLLEIIRCSGLVNAVDQVVLMAIDQLNRAGLLKTSTETNETDKTSLTRREMIRLIGIKSVAALPAISIIGIQPAIAHDSEITYPLRPHGAHCHSDGQCLSNHCGSHNSKCLG